MIPTFQQGQLGRSVASGVTTDANAVALYNAMVAYWDFEENDGTTLFLDGHGSNHLTIKRVSTGLTVATSAASAASGKPSRNFNPFPSSNYHSAYIPRSNTALDLPNSDFTFGGWFRGSNNGGIGGSACFLMGRLGAASGAFQAYLQINAADSKVYFGVSSNGTAVTLTPGTSSFAIAGEVTFITGTLDRTNNLIRLRMKNASGGSSCNVTSAFASALYTTSSTVNFCVNHAMSGDNTWFSGSRGLEGTAIIDSGFYCTRAIADAEFDYLYNSGNGRSYAQLKADAGH